MKKITALFLFISISVFSQGTWTQMSNFPGSARTGAVAFAIGAKGYMGTGQDAIGTMLKDFWEYDPATDTCAAKTNFGGSGRWGAVGFSIGAKGYIGTGSNTSDFWEYDPATNLWTAKAAYGGGAMSGSSGFGISSTAKGYLGGSGLDALSNFTKKFYEYDQATNVWTAKAQPPLNVSSNPPMRYWAVEFAIGTKGYLMSGMGTMAANCKDLYEYNPATNTWAAKANYTAGFGVWNSAGFSVGNLGYLLTGEDDTGTMPQNHRQYDPSTNVWTSLPNFPFSGRQVSTSFVVNGCGYIITGRDGTGALKEVWRWCPNVILPIELISFTGKNSGEKNILQWKTATEKNNDMFVLERSTDAVNFEPVATVKGAGNSTTVLAYRYTDAEFPKEGTLFYYRLKQIDTDKKMSTSGIIVVNISHKTTAAQIYFDVSANQVNVQYDFEKAGEYTIDVFDLLGKKVHTETIYVAENSENILTTALPSFPAGVFIAKFSDINGVMISQSKFVK